VNDDQHLIRDERDEPLEMTSRMISSFSEVEARPVLGGLHHRYVRVWGQPESTG
jgi:hypothetical protein